MEEGEEEGQEVGKVAAVCKDYFQSGVVQVELKEEEMEVGVDCGEEGVVLVTCHIDK